MKMRKGLESAIRGLFIVVANKLAAACRCTINTLPNELEKLYGKSLTTHGLRTGFGCARVNWVRATICNAPQPTSSGFSLETGWLSFPWRKPGAQIELLNSRDWYKHDFNLGETVIEKNEKGEPIEIVVLDPEWAQFVMSMSRDIYMGPHMNIPRGSNCEGSVAIAHSSWLAGTSVQCAGSMLVEEGVVKGIRNNSGHYKPSDNHLVSALELLRTVGVILSEVEVYDYTGKHQRSAPEFLRNGYSWVTWEKPQKAA